MGGVNRSHCVAIAVIVCLVTIQGGQAQIFNYTTAVSGWTGNFFDKYPSAQARPSK